MHTYYMHVYAHMYTNLNGIKRYSHNCKNAITIHNIVSFINLISYL